MMNHIYTQPQFGENWFGYEELYKEFVQSANPKERTIIVEVGSWKGKSIAYLAVEALNSGKNIQIFAVDTWLGTPGISDHYNDAHVQQGNLFDLFQNNIKDLKNVIPLRMTSEQASKVFANQSVHAVFIDADHSYESVKKDIELWYPKVTPGGIISGHDCAYPPEQNSVSRAVHEMFSSNQVKMYPANAWRVLKGI